MREVLPDQFQGLIGGGTDVGCRRGFWKATGRSAKQRGLLSESEFGMVKRPN